MNPQWHFNRRRACDRMRDSANDAFFTAESLENLSEALVREGIQNSLDAARRGAGGVRQITVKICFVPNAPAEARQFLAGHFASAPQNFERGLNCASLNALFGDDTGYLVFEDFGTKGLTGDVNEWRLDRAEQNAFFSFFRAEGRSSKSGENLGRWGIGKQVFPTASRLHAMFGLTVRADNPARVLMGSAVVRTHSIGEHDYQPDGWFGCREQDDNPVEPVMDQEFISSFERVFRLKRGSETGLSIVVPSVDERVNAADIKRGIVRSFFWPILLGELVVDLEAPGETLRIDAETLPTHRSLLPAPEAAVIEFASWASTAIPAERITLPETARPSWKDFGEQLLPESKLNEIRTRLETQQRVEIRVPVRVRPKIEGREDCMSFCTVYVASCRDAGHRPIFLRDGIVITDVRCPQMSGSRSIVVVDNPPLAGLLGDSEGVNHTQWQKDSPKFHNKYVRGPETIKFVTRSVYEILQRLHAADTKGDPTLLLHIFYLPTDEGSIEPKKKPEKEKKEPDIPPPPPPPPPPPQPRRFELQSVKGGFSLRPGNAPIESFPLKVRIEAGYAVRRGNAIKRWAQDDFAFNRLPLRQDYSNGVVVLRADGNSLELEIRKPDFQFAISGFDTKRDLVVRANELKGENEADV
ncbi:MAG: hypothetical protein EXS35_04685 [Pedosphaera sp.]|nr:hypothetical protein [Pedosphaera sp.]